MGWWLVLIFACFCDLMVGLGGPGLGGFAVWMDFLAIFDSCGVGIIQILRLGFAGGTLGFGWVSVLLSCGVIVVIDVVLLGFFAFCGLCNTLLFAFCGFWICRCLWGGCCDFAGFWVWYGCDGCVWTRYWLLVLDLAECGCAAWGGLGIWLVF